MVFIVCTSAFAFSLAYSALPKYFKGLISHFTQVFVEIPSEGMCVILSNREPPLCSLSLVFIFIYLLPPDLFCMFAYFLLWHVEWMLHDNSEFIWSLPYAWFLTFCGSGVVGTGLGWAMGKKVGQLYLNNSKLKKKTVMCTW